MNTGTGRGRSPKDDALASAGTGELSSSTAGRQTDGGDVGTGQQPALAHWFAGQIHNLQVLSGRHRQYQKLAAKGVAGSADAERQARKALLSAIRNLVEATQARPGIRASFAAYDGFLVEGAGEKGEDYEALAAMAQTILDTGRGASRRLKLGAPRQMVIIGERRKLAIVAAGELAVGLIGDSDISFAQALKA